MGEIHAVAADCRLPQYSTGAYDQSMDTALAIYEALLQANVPPPAARRVAESLEKDMSSNLATKQDIQHLDRLMATRFDAMDRRFGELEARVSLNIQNQESRIVIKLGTLMTILFGLSGTAMALLR
jgi:hypothetical protein